MVKIVTMTIREQVYEIIKLRIANGTYHHGIHLQEMSLAKELNVSRSPVREALKQLVAEELLLSAANKGVYVREFTEKEIHDLFDFRIIIESAAVSFLQRHPELVPAERLQQVRHNIMRQAPGNIDYAISDNVNPHYIIVQGMGNEYITRRHRQASYCTMSYHSLLFSGNNYEESICAHLGLIDKILEARFEQAARILREHLVVSRDQICTAISGSVK